MPMPPINRIHGVIFDMDGTLVDSQLDFERMRRDMGAPSGEPIIEYIDAQTCPIEQRRLWQVVEDHELRGAEAATWIPHAKRALAKLLAMSTPMAILTRNCRAATELTLKRLSIPITQAFTREDHPAKPDPSGLLHIAASWGISPTNLMYVGDYVFDLQAAANAGMTSCLYQPAAAPKFAEQADVVITCFSQLPELVLAQA